MISRKKSTEEPRWRIIEKIVSLLEKALTPVAQVEHDIFLPVIGRPDRRPRQCDIVITSGQPPRQTITIVEVQKRKSRPNINTFHGWIEKMREVGAQHLICVSALGFPQSIIDDVAMRYGPTVRLTTLKELEELNIAGFVLGNFLFHKKAHFLLEKFGPEVKVEPNPSTTDLEFEFAPVEKVFSLGDSAEKLNVFELFEVFRQKELMPLLFSRGQTIPDNGSVDVTLPSSLQENLYIYIEEIKHKVISLPMKWKIETEIFRIPLSHFEYKQEFIDSTLAWIASAKGVVEEKEITVQIVLKQDERGILQVAAARIEGVQELFLSLFVDEASWRSAFGT